MARWEAIRLRYRAPGEVAPDATDLTDAEWTLLEGIFSVPKRVGRPPTQARHVINGLLYKEATQCSWQNIPARYGHYSTCWRHFLHWQEDGRWAEIQRILEVTRKARESP